MTSDQLEPIGEGYVQVYTGNGKGKTTATLGLAFRAMGSGFKTYIGQFMKLHPYGELVSAKKVAPYITIEQYGRDQLICMKSGPEQVDIDAAQNGLEKAMEAMLSMKYEIVALDEILTACYLGLLSVSDILHIVENKPSGVELILTGRYAPQEVIDIANLVTEMTEIKHYYQQGIMARDGIER